ncbi:MULTISPECIES: AraC family transcriptional regulator [Comamonas]|jgi:AraC-like DNA-binding protein|uniref:AraC family transcriptional regulator n=1 Tax=Comamonas terrigena TaxID=32013 RepID=A0A2A7USC4_COMTR|nr:MULTISPECIES: AraC family transcriptional regulator [Comamonas]MBD9533416.1 AraC family transcriptional regulator [Comamonas sp. CMM01]MBV7418923.1 AraC family transcriptional regulator [Comamonas sp. CMM03]MDH0048144.1 AraC family transcriptional regulator [Comamonas terrigena]MDH0510257.1 AraC family transcriptional regulator [Comamonas terrigena]MDH1089858.1 AraC family transcriptional regulator [Comamonas terrigena]
MYTPSLVPETASALHASPALTPMAFVQAVVWAYAKRDLDPIAALQAAQIAPEQVAKTRARITALQMELLCAHAMRELDDEALGWFGRRLPWGSYGMLARASISSPTLGLAMARWCRHHGLLNDDVTLELVRHGELAELRLQERRDLGPVREFCTVSLLRNAHGVASWLIDARLPLLEASFPFAAPPHADAYPLMFPGTVTFDAPWASLRFEARLLDLPLARDETALQQMLQRALPIQVLPYRREKQWSARVRQLLVADTQLLHTADTLARALLVSPRSLHRQLQTEGQTLQALKDSVRLDRATTLLLRSDRPLKRIAQACGFASDKSFLRAFKAWTGHSPAEYRALHRVAD